MQAYKNIAINIRTLLILVSFIVGGCTATSQRLHPDFSDYHHAMGVILVLMPEIVIYEQMPDGSRILRDRKSQTIQRHTQQAIVRQLKARNFSVQTADATLMQSPDIVSVTALFRAVNRAIQLHTYGPQPYPVKINAFEYHLGPVAEILAAKRADGLLLVLGHQTASDQPARNWLSVALAEPNGRIIWYAMHGDHKKFDLQTTQGTDALVNYTMANFREQG